MVIKFNSINGSGTRNLGSIEMTITGLLESIHDNSAPSITNNFATYFVDAISES